MPDQLSPDLDDRIRHLVARAVSDAPPAPDITTVGIRSVPGTLVRRSPWLYPSVVMAAAAAIGALVIITVRDPGHVVGTRDTTTTGPATVVTSTTLGSPTTTAAVPSTTVSPVTTASTTIPTSVVVTTTTPVLPTTTAPVVTTTLPPVTNGPLHGESVVTAGLDGVSWIDDGRALQVTNQPMAAAVEFETGPGTAAIVMQKRSGYELESGPGDTTLMIWRSSTRQLTPLLTDPVADGFYRLYDAALVDGVPTLLFAVEPMAVDITTPPGQLYVMSLVDMVPVEVAEVGGWEAGTSRLHLANNGVIVGGLQNGPTTTFASWSIGAAPPISPQQLGLDPAGWSDCSECPHAFTISRDGSTVGWIEHGGLGLVRLAGDEASSASVPADVTDDWSIDIADDGQLLVGFDQPSSFVELPPAHRVLPGGETSADLPGTWAALGTSRLPQDPMATYPGAAWRPVTDVTLAETFSSADAAAQALQDALVATLPADGGPRLRRDAVDGPNGVLLVWTNVPDDSVVEQYYFLELEPGGDGVRVVSLQTASLGRNGLICGTSEALCP